MVDLVNLKNGLGHSIRTTVHKQQAEQTNHADKTKIGRNEEPCQDHRRDDLDRQARH
jgi:hypothetical protein